MNTKCPKCSGFKNPLPTVDIIIRYNNGLVLIERKNPPHGLALPGGYVDYGETLREAAIREAKEETNLDIDGLGFFNYYDSPNRDPRYHTMSFVFFGTGKGAPKATDDADKIIIVPFFNIPELVFDHNQILNDFNGVRKQIGR